MRFFTVMFCNIFFQILIIEVFIEEMIKDIQ
jgi:hypothetical protein